ncbi:hypothetical protein E2C01_074699 [Portunus trituberculatus]|uniref:Uncharacterized protein n=1 Tax=Portunus trituberculatus TaxID=210409 RepID=A0A5B7I416_PORTR|nr:hypothetical protein [Portunus trituberculatus]
MTTKYLNCNLSRVPQTSIRGFLPPSSAASPGTNSDWLLYLPTVNSSLATVTCEAAGIISMAGLQFASFHRAAIGPSPAV